MIVRKGKQYRRVNRPGAGHPKSARTKSATARYDVYFDAAKKGAIESLVRAWREATPDRDKDALTAYYRSRDYEIMIDDVEFIEGSSK